MDHKAQLLDFYRENPCRTLPNAFWKAARQMESSRLSIRRNAEGDLSALALWQESHLMAFWCADAEDHPLTPQQIAQVPFALVHSTSLQIFKGRAFTRREGYFRIVHQGVAQKRACPQGFAFRNVKPETEAETVAQFILRCYPDVNITSSHVRAWLEHPVYDPNLWVWIFNQDTGECAGLGIAERDREVPEVSLEWIQVLPSFRKRGLGAAIVNELLCRVTGDVKFVTVSGKTDNDFQLEKFYQQLGFIGSDVWWLLAS